ncbi:hypothetical protein B0T21DRAFT_375072 [Apiosordaria backusii]|uniref:Uncharacterized protein n=1 Tax=Apiosordaria backusii TaxID=314023 RepID=A0AA40AIK0_9PEZI|nr:hypothetical protein B0T21DRAFT_375072 [Apiosordaria backusii]
MERPTTSRPQRKDDITSTSDDNNNWDEAVPRILELLDQLEEANAEFGALVWEYDWERRDMLEDIQSMRQMLREGIVESSFFHSQIQRVLDADATEIISDLEAALRAERSKNWELSYYARDIEEDKWKLQVRMREIIPARDNLDPLSKAKTAMERALEMEIAELRETIRNPKGRGRSKSV